MVTHGGAGGNGRGDRPPSASVIVTAYATPARLLDISLTSLRRQTLDDLEMIIVIDGELPDDAEIVLERHVRNDPRMVLLRPGRVGRARALNVGLATARSPLIGIQDADDASHPRRLEVQAALLRSVPRLSVLGARARISTSLIEEARWEIPPEEVPVRIIGRELLRSNALVHSSVLMRRAAIERVGGYDEHRTAQFDYDLMLRLAADGAVLGLCDRPLVLHRRHPGQFFEGLAPVRRAWGSCRLQMEHIADLHGPARPVYYGIAAVRFGYQVARGVAWHHATARRRVTG